MATDKEIVTMPIDQAVQLAGGNGLASPAFQAPSVFISIFSWQQVEAGVEALVCDGELVPQTRFSTDLQRIIKRRRFLRRVMLKPPPLEVSASALSSDQLQVTLQVSFRYEVADPVAVASLQAPLRELADTAIGVVTEYIRTRTLSDLYADQGLTRVALKDKLAATSAIEATYIVHEVLKALPTGDERLIDIEIRKRAATAQAGLIQAEGANKLAEANTAQQIARSEALLRDDMADRQHQRDMEKERLDKQADIAQAAIAALGHVAQSGIDPTPIARDMMKFVAQQLSASGTPPATPIGPTQHPPQIESSQATLADAERQALASIKETVGILSCEVIEAKGLVKGAIVQMARYEIVITCGDDYPRFGPSVAVRFADGRTFQPRIFWIPNTSNIAQAVLAVVPQIPEEEL